MRCGAAAHNLPLRVTIDFTESSPMSCTDLTSSFGFAAAASDAAAAFFFFLGGMVRCGAAR